MKIESKLGLVDYDDDDNIEMIIRKCAVGRDDIWICGDSEYPCLAISVNGENAVVHYFSSKQDGHYQSIGNNDTDGTTEFLAGGEILEAPNYIMVPLSSAIQCAKQFLISQERPSCIEWDKI